VANLFWQLANRAVWLGAFNIFVLALLIVGHNWRQITSQIHRNRLVALVSITLTVYVAIILFLLGSKIIQVTQFYYYTI
jgi:hypothetical protein